MDALTLLKADHDKVKKQLSDLVETTERGVRPASVSTQRSARR